MARTRIPAFHSPLPHSEGSARVRRLAQGQSSAEAWVGDGLELGRKTNRIQVKKARGVRESPAAKTPAMSTVIPNLGSTDEIEAFFADIIVQNNSLREDYLELKDAYDTLARGMLEAKTGER